MSEATQKSMDSYSVLRNNNKVLITGYSHINPRTFNRLQSCFLLIESENRGFNPNHAEYTRRMQPCMHVQLFPH